LLRVRLIMLSMTLMGVSMAVLGGVIYCKDVLCAESAILR
jgi:hypothetical protein